MNDDEKKRIWELEREVSDLNKSIEIIKSDSEYLYSWVDRQGTIIAIIGGVLVVIALKLIWHCYQ